MVKRLPMMQETQVQSLGREDFLEKKMATHPRILAWKIPWMEETGRLQSMGSQRDMTERLHHLNGASLLPLDVGYFFFFLVGSNILLSMVAQQQVAVLEFL